MAIRDVPDSTDWLETPLSGLAAVEASLRCQVCKDFYRTPMLTSCSHTFCSLCIRRALSSDGKCPLCRAPEQEMKLRSNWAMEETIDAFTRSRTQFFKVAAAAKGAQSGKLPKRSWEDANGDGEPETKRTRTSARLSKRAEEESAPVYRDQVEQEAFVVPDSDDENDGAYEPDLDDGLVACPMCESRMKEWQVFKHLESCPGPTPKPKGGESSALSQLNSQKRQSSNIERLPALAYGMLRDTALRKKLQDLGLHTWGSRQNLELRHREWITLWNANCDAARPKKRSELLHELDVWERTQGGMASSRSKSVASGPAVKDKDFDGAGWAKNHDDSFRDLIATARRTREEARQKAAKAKEEDEKAQGDTQNTQTAAPAPRPQDPGSATNDYRLLDDQRSHGTSLPPAEQQQSVQGSDETLVLGQPPPPETAQIPYESRQPFIGSQDGHQVQTG